MNLLVADLNINQELGRNAMIALTGGSITVLSPWSTYSSSSSYSATSYGSYHNLSKSVFGWKVIYGKKRYEYRTKTTIAKQRRSRSVYF
jgi:hypothetical protein